MVDGEETKVGSGDGDTDVAGVLNPTMLCAYDGGILVWVYFRAC